MKILFPIGAITFAAGMCCCGGFSEDFEQGMKEGIQEELEKQAAEAAKEAGGEAGGVTGGEAAGGAAAGGGASAGVDCGSFNSLGFSAPAGAKQFACTNSGGNESLLFMGGPDPKTACDGLKADLTGKGYKKTLEAGMGDTQSIIFEVNGKRLTVACTSASGQNTISMVLSGT